MSLGDDRAPHRFHDTTPQPRGPAHVSVHRRPAGNGPEPAVGFSDRGVAAPIRQRSTFFVRYHVVYLAAGDRAASRAD